MSTDPERTYANGGNVEWVVAPNILEELDLPSQILENNRYLAATIEGMEVAVGVFALPPAEPSATGFWPRFLQKIQSRLRPDEQIPVARLRLEPQVAYDQFVRTEHTPLSGRFPYVVMEDGTRYGIGLWTPREWIGQWTELKERPAERGGKSTYMLDDITEVYRQRQTIALLVRLNGDTPLAEIVMELKGPQPVRRESIIGINETAKEVQTQTQTFTGITKRVVTTIRGLYEVPFGDTDTRKSKVSDLVFHVVADRGTEENAVVDDRGLVDIIVCQVTNDEVVGEKTKPRIFFKTEPSPATGWPYSQDSASTLMGFDSAKRAISIPDATEKGVTEFGNTRVQKVRINTVRGVKPIARFQFALVGPGGPITAIMEEAPPPSTGQ